jgi:hypothetical protein
MADDIPTDLEDVDLDEAPEILQTLAEVEERMETLRAERERLFEANQMLVELVEHLENELSGYVDPEDVGSISVEGYEYSFGDGWRSTEEGHKKRLEMDSDVDVNEVENQINEVRESIRRVDQRD